jgi:hypothetical protein
VLFHGQVALRGHRIRGLADAGSGVPGVAIGRTPAIETSTGRTSTMTGTAAIITGASSDAANGQRVSTGGDAALDGRTEALPRPSTAGTGGRSSRMHRPMSQTPVEMPR